MKDILLFLGLQFGINSGDVFVNLMFNAKILWRYFQSHMLSIRDQTTG